MQYFGFFLIFVALVALIIGILQQMKAKKILAAPFKKTGEIAQNPAVADAKGTISTEGAMVVQQPLMAPCSGKPAIYYEIELVRHWEKSVQTENGMKTEKGTTSISTNRVGSQIYINDGSGPVGADFRQDVDCELEKSFEQMQNVAWGDIVFGQYRTHVPHHGGDERTVGVKAIEKIIPAQGNIFVMGKLVAGVITKADGLLGKLVASTKGRDKLLGATKRNAIIGFVAGGLSLAGGIPMSIFGDPPKDSCANMKDGLTEACHGHIYDDNGTSYDWTVSKPGTYTISIAQPQVKDPIWPVLTIKEPGGSTMLQTEKTTESVSLTQSFTKPGKYSLNIKDSVKGHVQHLKGGYSFTLNIAGPTGAPAPADSGSAAPSGSAMASAAPHAPTPPPPVTHASAHPSAAPSGKAAPGGKAPPGKAPPGKKK
jgi:hypothetical protein